MIIENEKYFREVLADRQSGKVKVTRPQMGGGGVDDPLDLITFSIFLSSPTISDHVCLASLRHQLSTSDVLSI